MTPAGVYITIFGSTQDPH
jgi:hypothetical protein